MNESIRSIADGCAAGRGYFADYRETVARRVAAVEVRTPNRDSFSSSIAERTLGQLRLFHIQSDAVSITRSSRCISHDANNQYIVAINTTGDCVVQHGHAALSVPANAFYLLDKALPYETVFPRRSSRILICVPRPLLEQRVTDPGRALSWFASADAGASRIAADYIASLFREAGEVDARGQLQFAEICLDLVAMVLSGDGLAPEISAMCPASIGRQALRSRIKAYVRCHLDDPGLGPARICEATGISKRYLHQLFSETQTSVCAWIREQRLNETYAALRNPRLKHLSITRIAYDRGFSDAAHFSRLFKLRFGVAPSRLRAGSVSDGARPG